MNSVPFLRNEWQRAEYLTRHGKSVILSEQLYVFEPEVSDGALGIETIIHGIYDTEAEARAELALYADNDCNGDIQMYIYRLPAAPVGPLEPDTDEIPF